jgi:RNA recognition motif-containing protein
MDISSLLSPEDPDTSKARSPPKSSPSHGRRGTGPISAPSVPSQIQPPNTSTHSSYITTPENGESNPPSYIRATDAPPPNGHLYTPSIVTTPPTDAAARPGPNRVASTPGMDTLADLASMQHHQQTARSTSGGMKLTPGQLSPAPSHTSTRPQAPPRTHSVSQGSVDLKVAETPAPAPRRRSLKAASMSDQDLQATSQLFTFLEEHPHEFESHKKLLELLHQGFTEHVRANGNARAWELLQEYQQATQAMDARFALGEELWAARIYDQQILARSVEECLGVIETYEKIVREEAGSTKLWRSYGEWILSLYMSANTAGQVSTPSQGDLNKSQYWSMEDKVVAAEVFTRTHVLDIWKRGSEETQFRINDSHVIWDRYTEMLLEELAQAPSKEAVLSVRTHYVDRLATPHATWDATFQDFSVFVSTYDNAAYEETMVAVNQNCADAKAQYEAREMHELKLRRVGESGDKIAEWNAFNEYLEWEISQNHRHKVFNFDLACALYTRANIRFGTSTALWEDYLMFLFQEFERTKISSSVIAIIERACRHCPWSGDMWALYIQSAEREKQSFAAIGEIKHKATSTGLLDAGGLEEILKVHTAWCSFLRRQAFQHSSTDDELDVAEVGIRSAIEDMETLGVDKYQREYKGDPQYRLERIYIKFLSQSRDWNRARERWKNLSGRHKDSHEFWLRWFGWEMVVWGVLGHSESASLHSEPKEATEVLRQALKIATLDWPEKIVDTLLRHAEDNADVKELQNATVLARKAMKAITKRRQKEALEVVEQAQRQAYAEPEHPGSSKRKRGDTLMAESPAKKTRTDAPDVTMGDVQEPAPAESALKRDRENATIIVKNIPSRATEGRVREYFKQCGTIISIKLDKEKGETQTATIEFESKDDVVTAQTRDMKSFDGNQIKVQAGSGSTLFVTNFPPTADEAYIRSLFQKYGEIVDIRFPSLKYNTHRRFCYVQFKSSNQAKAATDLDGSAQDGKLKLVAKISDPTKKQDRSGAMHEGREVHVANLDWSATEEEIKEIFSKYGKVETVRIPRNVQGNSKGMAFVGFSNKVRRIKYSLMDDLC